MVGGVSVPVHFTDQLVVLTPVAGDCPPQTLSTAGSTRLATTAPDRSVLLWYSPYRPVPVPVDGLSAPVGTGGSEPSADGTPWAKVTVVPAPARDLMPW